jgi:hypothetical protein
MTLEQQIFRRCDPEIFQIISQERERMPPER